MDRDGEGLSCGGLRCRDEEGLGCGGQRCRGRESLSVVGRGAGMKRVSAVVRISSQGEVKASRTSAQSG